MRRIALVRLPLGVLRKVGMSLPRRDLALRARRPTRARLSLADARVFFGYFIHAGSPSPLLVAKVRSSGVLFHPLARPRARMLLLIPVRRSSSRRYFPFFYCRLPAL